MNEPKYVGNYARITDVSKYPPEDAALLGRIGLINDVSIIDDAVFAVSIMIDDREELINVGHFEVLGAQEVGRIADDTNRLKTMVKRMYEWIIDADINGEMDIWHYDGDIPHDNYWDWRGLLAEFELEATGKLDGYEPPSEGEDVS